MLFELRRDVPKVSPEWIDVRDLFLSGRSRQAWKLATSRRGKTSMVSPNDFLLNIEIARACCTTRRYFGLSRLAHRRFPDDPFVQLYHSRTLLSRDLFMSAVDFLQEKRATLGKRFPVLWSSQLANVYGSAGFETSCRDWIAKTRNESDVPLVTYHISCAYEGIREWKLATEYSRQCVAQTPHWVRARVLLVHCLLTRGKIAEAQEVLADGQAMAYEDAMLDFSAAMLAFSLGEFDRARQLFETIVVHWPDADFVPWVRRSLCILLVELEEYDKAHDLIAGQEKELSFPEIKRPESPVSHKFIPLPILAQNKNQCVPTSVSMAIYPQGKKLDPDRLFHEMHGRNGTDLWRMRHWVEENGFRLVPIRLEKEAVIEMLDQGIPLIGTLEGPFNSHVDVLCGYHEQLQVFYVRDPMHWAPTAWPYDIALQRYEMHDSVFAVIDLSNEAASQSARRLKSVAGEALLDLTQAIAEGDLEAATAAAALVPDDTHSAFLRDCISLHVVLSPNRFKERMQHYAESDKSNFITRFRALLALGAYDAQDVLKQLLEQHEEKLGTVGTRYLRLLECMQEGDWQQAKTIIDRFLLFGSGVSTFWDLRSDVFAELGDQQESERSLDLAIELEPYRTSFREKSLIRAANRLTFDDYLKELDSLIAADPDERRLLWNRLQALREGPDGKLFEAAAKEYLKWFPRDPRGYDELIAWYDAQHREDLSKEFLEQGRQLLEDHVQDPEQQPSTDDVLENGELPKDKEELFQLIWNNDASLRSQAFEALQHQEDAGSLQWYDRARLTANRIVYWEKVTELNEEDSRRLFPVPTPGPSHWFANAVTGVLSQCDLTLATARAAYRWTEEAVDQYQNYPELWFNRVLLMEQARQNQAALAELQEFLDKYPAYSTALYRMGVVKHQQGDLRSAESYFKQALSVNGGLYGAMFELRAVYDTQGMIGKQLEMTRRLRKKMPYEFAFHRDEVLAVEKQKNRNEAAKVLRKYTDDFPEKRLALLRGELAFQAGLLKEAEGILRTHNVSDQDSDDLFEQHLQLGLSIATEQANSTLIGQLCDSGLTRWPDSTRLKEIKAEYLVQFDAEASEELLRDVLLTGDPSVQTAHQYLQAVKKQPNVAAQMMVDQSEELRRLTVARLFAEVMCHHSYAKYGERYLRWALDKFPESDDLRWHLVGFYFDRGQVREATKLAREVFDRNPNHPEAARLLGSCLMEANPKKALPYLEQACEQDRSFDNLFELARCHHNAKNHQKAKSLYWEILESNPYAASTWTNLSLLNPSFEKLWPFVDPMLKNGCGESEQYFLVAVVKAALATKQHPAKEWFPLALRRLEALKSSRVFGNELVELKRAALVWKSLRPQDVPRDIASPKGMLELLIAKCYWPRSRWVPVDTVPLA